MAEEQTSEPMWPFNYRNVQDPATKAGYIAGDIFIVIWGLWFMWGLFWPH